MNKIKSLYKYIIDKVCLNKFFNKPYLILKKLIENSIRAKSNLIKIYIINKGMSLIKVIDNGIGINKDKFLIYLNNNYFNNNEKFIKLNYLNFKKKFIYNIGLISNLIIYSKFNNERLGWCLYNNYINNLMYFNSKSVLYNLGTNISIYNIFFNNLIYRNKLLKSLNCEWLYIKRLINNFVICNYNISFYFFNNNKLYKKYIFNNNYKKYLIIYKIKCIYGEKFIRYNLYIDIYNTFWYCYGYFFFKTNKIVKIIYINKKLYFNKNFLFYIFDSFINNYLEYINISYILYFFIDLNYININISKNKNKIFFLNTLKIYNSVYNNLILYFKKNNIIKYIKLYSVNKNLEIKNNILDYLHLDSPNKFNYLQYFYLYFGKIFNIFNNKYLISIKNNYLIFSNIFLILYYMNYLVIKNKLYFLIWTKNILIKLNNIYKSINLDIIKILFKLGIFINLKNNNFYIVKVPLIFVNINFKLLLFELNKFLFINKNIKNKEFIVIYWLTYFIINNNMLSINNYIVLVTNFCKIIDNISSFNKKLFKIINLDEFLLFYI